MKNIHWLVPHKVKEPKDISLSNLASIRLRTSLFNLPVFSEYKISINESIDDINNVDYLFISKFPSNRDDIITN